MKFSAVRDLLVMMGTFLNLLIIQGWVVDPKLSSPILKSKPKPKHNNK